MQEGHRHPVYESRGIQRGLSESLVRWFRRLTGAPYSCNIHDVCQLVLAVPDWDSWSWVEHFTLTIPANTGTEQTLFTVPADERVKLLGVSLIRTGSGANALASILAALPVGYGTGSRNVALLTITAASQIYWPAGTVQVGLTDGSLLPPLPLEPGTVLTVSPSSGAATETTVACRLLMTRTKLIRDKVP